MFQVAFRVAVAGLVAMLACRAQGSACQATLLKLVDKNDPKHYQDRPDPNPDRCEGVYDPQRSIDEGPLLLASYTSLREPVDTARDGSVQLRWTSPGNPAVRIRCYSLRRGDPLVYQMDAFRDFAKQPFLWPLKIVRDAGLQNADLGILGWAIYQTPRGSQTVYVPMQVRNNDNSAGPAAAPEVEIVPTNFLNKVTLTVEQLNADFTTAATLVSDVDLTDEVSTSPNQPIRLEARHLKIAKAGFYYVSVGAWVTDGPNKALPFYLYYAP